MIGFCHGQNEQQREAILRHLLKTEPLNDTSLIPTLASITDSYSGSDLKELCKTACVYPIREMIDEKRKKGYRLCEITMDSYVRPLNVF